MELDQILNTWRQIMLNNVVLELQEMAPFSCMGGNIWVRDFDLYKNKFSFDLNAFKIQWWPAPSRKDLKLSCLSFYNSMGICYRFGVRVLIQKYSWLILRTCFIVDCLLKSKTSLHYSFKMSRYHPSDGRNIISVVNFSLDNLYLLEK